MLSKTLNLNGGGGGGESADIKKKHANSYSLSFQWSHRFVRILGMIFLWMGLSYAETIYGETDWE